MEENAAGGDGRVLPGAEVVAIDDDGDEGTDLPGMDGVIVTSTGYTGIQRLKLVALINKTGASFIGDLSSSHTHLVCWKYTGKKYLLSKNLGITIVNHRWFEDCLRAGRRLQEEPYTRKCGEQVGPVAYDQTKTASSLRKPYVPRPQGTQTSYLKELDSMLEETALETREEVKRQKPLDGPGKENRSCRPKNHGENSFSDELDTFLLHSDTAGPSKSPAPLSGEPHQRREVVSRRPRTRVLQRVPQASSSSKRRVQRLAPDFCKLKQRKVDSYLQSRSRPKTVPLLQSPPVELVRSLSDTNVADVEPARKHESASTSTSGLSTSSSSSDEDVACVICHDESQTNVEGVLPCGHDFCFDCIKRWGLHSAGSPQCPLCKAPFDFITKREPFISLADDSQNKRYFETVVAVENKNQASRGDTILVERSCLVCHGRDAENLLLVCNVCRNRAVHTFCLDPPRVNALYPWECHLCLEQGRYRF